MSSHEPTFDEILELAGELEIFNILDAGQSYAFMLRIADPSSMDAQRIYQTLLRLKEDHDKIDHNFHKLVKKIMNDFEVGLTDVVVKSKRDKMEEAREDEVQESQKAAEELIESL